MSKDHNDSIQISLWDPSSISSALLYNIFSETIGSIPAYSTLPLVRFDTFLKYPAAKVFVATVHGSQEPVGFALTYTTKSGSVNDPAKQYLQGGISLLLVSPSHKHHGIGTALYNETYDDLSQRIHDSLIASKCTVKESKIIIGSWFPRIFPGIPLGSEFDLGVKWLQEKGWTVRDEMDYDLYRSFPDYRDSNKRGQLGREMKELMKQAEGLGYSFGPPEERHDKELVEMEYRNFLSYTGWPDTFPMLLQAGHRKDIHCVFDAQGKVIGAAVAAVPNRNGEDDAAMTALYQSFAWPSTLGKSCGIMACVGIDSKVRGSGAGIGLVASAVLDMVDRGADGCSIDRVREGLKSFYQKAGFEVWERGYRTVSKAVT